MKNKKLTRVYLASPYSHKDVRVIEARYGEAILAAAALQMAHPRHNIFSPIVNSHPLAKIGGLRGDWEFWQTLDTDHIEHSHEIWVLEIPGWTTSTGVTAELEIAKKLKLPIRYVSEIAGKGYCLKNTPFNRVS